MTNESKLDSLNEARRIAWNDVLEYDLNNIRYDGEFSTTDRAYDVANSRYLEELLKSIPIKSKQKRSY
jgi:hypothetical protein